MAESKKKQRKGSTKTTSRPKWTADGGIDHEPATQVGDEQPGGQAKLADQRGRLAGQVRLHPTHALGDTAAANRELKGVGGIRVAATKWDEANATQGSRVRIATGGERARIAVKRHVYAQGRLARSVEVTLPNCKQAVTDAEAVLETKKAEYGALPLVERGVRFFNVLARVEVAAILAACFDGFALAHPLQAAGLTDAADKWILIAFVAAGIYVAVHAIGVAGGYLGLALGGQRRKGAILILAGVAGALFAGFFLVGVMRHAWTQQINAGMARAVQGKPYAPGLLDAVFLVPLQMGVAAGAAALIAVFVMGDRGRTKLREIATAEDEVATAVAELKVAKREIEVAHGEVETADIAINEANVDRDAAGEELEVIREAGRAQREGENARTQAAVARQEIVYRTTDKCQDNGGVWLAALPDNKRRPVDARHVATGAQDVHGEPDHNGHRPTGEEDIDRLVGDFDSNPNT